MKKQPVFNFTIERLKKSHRREDFSCGDDALDRYIRQQASQDQKKNVAATFVLVDRDSGSIAGFYTLSMNSVLLNDLPEETRRHLPRYPDIPAALLGRLAVDTKYKGRRLGEHLLMDAMRRCLDSEIAVFCLIVDAYEGAVEFYASYGFMELPGHANRMFLPMRTIEKLLKEETV
ncbi:MAG: GNAT family N-acetyltransferase [Thermodesulfobacteriota bacterium]